MVSLTFLIFVLNQPAVCAQFNISCRSLVVRGGRLMVFFLMSYEHRGQKATNEAIKLLVLETKSSDDTTQALETLNQRATMFKKQFWIWTVSQLRAQPGFQKSQLCMWTSYFLKSRGLSWLGMDSLAEQGVVCSRRSLTRWMKQEASAMNKFCR